MSFDAGAAVGSLELDAKQFLAELKKVNARLGRLEDEAESARQGISRFGKAFAIAGAAITTAAAGFLAARAGLRALTAQLSEATRESADFEQVVQELGVTLSLAGVSGVADVVEGLKEYASTVQDTTSFADGFVLKVSQTLAVLGVQEDKLKDATTAVLNYAAATGRDAVQSAVQFGKTLSGLLGELGETFPALRALTAEELKAGAAFDFAGERMERFAERVAETSRGLSLRLQNAVDDFQKQVGSLVDPFLNEIKKGAREAVEELTTFISENRASAMEYVRQLGLDFLDVIEGIVGGFTTMRLGLLDFITTVEQFIPNVVGTFKQLRLELRESDVAINEFLVKVPLVGKFFKDDLADAREEAAGFRREIDAAASVLGEAQREADRIRAEIEKQGRALEGVVNSALEKAREKIRNIKFDFAKVNEETEGLGGSATRTAARLEELRNRAAETAGEMASAAASASAMEEATTGASRAAGGGAGGTGGLVGGAAGGRGGAVGLRLGDPFETLATLRTQESRLAGVGAGWVQRAQRGVVEGIRGVLQGQIDRAFRDYTSGILSELSSRGIFDEQQRSTIVRERLAEAERLGVLPQRGAAQLGQRTSLIG